MQLPYVFGKKFIRLCISKYCCRFRKYSHLFLLHNLCQRKSTERNLKVRAKDREYIGFLDDARKNFTRVLKEQLQSVYLAPRFFVTGGARRMKGTLCSFLYQNILPWKVIFSTIPYFSSTVVFSFHRKSNFRDILIKISSRCKRLLLCMISGLLSASSNLKLPRCVFSIKFLFYNLVSSKDPIFQKYRPELWYWKRAPLICATGMTHMNAVSSKAQLSKNVSVCAIWFHITSFTFWTRSPFQSRDVFLFVEYTNVNESGWQFRYVWAVTSILEKNIIWHRWKEIYIGLLLNWFLSQWNATMEIAKTSEKDITDPDKVILNTVPCKIPD